MSRATPPGAYDTSVSSNTDNSFGTLSSRNFFPKSHPNKLPMQQNSPVSPYPRHRQAQASRSKNSGEGRGNSGEGRGPRSSGNNTSASPHSQLDDRGPSSFPLYRYEDDNDYDAGATGAGYTQSEPGVSYDHQLRFKVAAARLTEEKKEPDVRRSQRQPTIVEGAHVAYQHSPSQSGWGSKAVEDHRDDRMSRGAPEDRGMSGIETPSPRVTSLKQRLWDDQERLQQGWSKKGYQQSQQQRRAVPVSSTPSRVAQRYAQQQSDVEPRYAQSDVEPRFKSRYYHAAAAIASAHSPDRSSGSRLRPVFKQSTSHMAPLKEEPPVETSMNESQSVATLLAKISAVNRADPNAALAQIDAILRQESGSQSDATPAAPPAPRDEEVAAAPLEEEEQEDGSDGSEDETEVSSITNPTYQGSPKSDKRMAVHVHSGKPRPSKLQAYQQQQQRRRKKPLVTPPATITASSRKVKASNAWPTRPKSPMEAAQNFAREVENVLSSASSDEIAEKLRQWEGLSESPAAPRNKLSNEVLSNTTEDLGSLVSTKESGALSPVSPRSHPWDASAAAAPGRKLDTSMESAVGVELELEPEEEEPPELKIDKSKLASLCPDPNDAYESAAWEPEQHQAAERSRSTKTNKYTSRARQSRSRERTAHANSLSEDFDSAWVSLPSSTFFPNPAAPGGQNRYDSKRRDRRNGEYHEEESEEEEDHVDVPEESRGFQRIEPHASSAAKRSSKYQAPDKSADALAKSAYDQAPITSDVAPVVETVEVSLVENPTPTKKRGLRGFLRSRRGRSAVRSSAGHVSLGNGVLEQDRSLEEVPPPPRRGRRISKSPAPRGRARSLEERRPRNPSIARKFSRMLRVYDDNDAYEAEKSNF